MIHIKLNNKTVTALPDQNLLQLAKANGIEIPSMCFVEGMPHFTSCMICLVKDKQTGKLLPSCSLQPVDGLDNIILLLNLIDGKFIFRYELGSPVFSIPAITPGRIYPGAMVGSVYCLELRNLDNFALHKNITLQK